MCDSIPIISYFGTQLYNYLKCFAIKYSFLLTVYKVKRKKRKKKKEVNRLVTEFSINMKWTL